MSSTRHKNSPENYNLEQYGKMKQLNMREYVHFTNAVDTKLPCDGLLPARIAPTSLSHNPTDIENFLFGIGSNNLVNPLAPIEPQFKTLDTLSIIDRIPLICPDDLVITPNQRPYNA
jgi:hypothetical protein